MRVQIYTHTYTYIHTIHTHTIYIFGKFQGSEKFGVNFKSEDFNFREQESLIQCVQHGLLESACLTKLQGKSDEDSHKAHIDKQPFCVLQGGGGGRSYVHMVKRLKIGFSFRDCKANTRSERERESLPFIPTMYHFPR